MYAIPCPSHPGKVLKSTIMRKDGGISLTEFARRLNVGRLKLARIVNGHDRISPAFAARLDRVLGGSAALWLNMQQGYDRWCERQEAGAPPLRLSRVQKRRLRSLQGFDHRFRLSGFKLR